MDELDLTSLSLEDLVIVIERSGGDITLEQLREDIEEGAPTNQDGTVNFLHYGAWLFAQI